MNRGDVSVRPLRPWVVGPLPNGRTLMAFLMGLILTTEPSPAMILQEGTFESGESKLSFQETQSLAGRRFSTSRLGSTVSPG